MKVLQHVSSVSNLSHLKFEECGKFKSCDQADALYIYIVNKKKLMYLILYIHLVIITLHLCIGIEPKSKSNRFIPN